MCKDGFTRDAAPDGIHETVEFNEYRKPKWWSEQRHREWLIERLMPFAIVAGALIGFCVVGIVEMTR